VHAKAYELTALRAMDSCALFALLFPVNGTHPAMIGRALPSADRLPGTG